MFEKQYYNYKESINKNKRTQRVREKKQIIILNKMLDQIRAKREKRDNGEK